MPIHHPGRPFTIVCDGGPLVAAAVHDGHRVRPEVAVRLALSDAERLREEDPFTAAWTAVAPTRIVVHRSRFEVDVNRPRDRAVYRSPEDAWGLDVWRDELPEALVDRSLATYDAFYEAVDAMLAAGVSRHGRVVVYDIHSYNHRRAGADAEPDDPEANPEVNVGTGTMDRAYWAPIVDRLVDDLRSVPVLGRALDVRENVKFEGGHFPAWLNRRFGSQVCAIAIEFKKTFMNEWTGAPCRRTIDALVGALSVAAAGTREELAAW